MTSEQDQVKKVEHYPLLLTLHEAAMFVGLAPRTLLRYARSGKAPLPLKLTPGAKSGCSRFRRVDLETWVAEGCPTWKGRTVEM